MIEYERRSFIHYLNEKDLLHVAKRSLEKVNKIESKLEGGSFYIGLDSIVFLESLLEYIIFGNHIDIARKNNLNVDIAEFNYLYREELISTHGIYTTVLYGIRGVVNIKVGRDVLQRYKFEITNNGRRIILYGDDKELSEIERKEREFIRRFLYENRDKIKSENEELDQLLNCWKNPDYPGTLRKLCEREILDILSG